VGVKVTSQVAVFGPLELRPQLVLPNDPLDGAARNDTVPVGAVAPVDAVSLTVTVHVVSWPVVTEDGAQVTLVEVGSSGAPDPVALHSSLPVAPSSAAKNTVPFSLKRPLL
jgi:hypothetical protein